MTGLGAAVWALAVLGVCAWGRFAVGLTLGRARWHDGSDPSLRAAVAVRFGERGVPMALCRVDLRVGHAAWAVRGDRRRVFEIGSVTKPVTGALLSAAARRGVVDVDAPVSDQLPEVSGAPVATATLRELARHTAGLPRLGRGPWPTLTIAVLAALGVDPYLGCPERVVLRRARHAGCAGRGAFAYSNLGAALAGAAVARAAGRPWHDLVEQALSAHGAAPRPVGLQRWRWVGRNARGFVEGPWSMAGYAPAGALAGDVGRLSAVLSLLLREAVTCLTIGEEMLFAFADDARGTYEHDGGTAGHTAYVVLDPRREAGVLIVQASGDLKALPHLRDAAHRLLETADQPDEGRGGRSR